MRRRLSATALVIAVVLSGAAIVQAANGAPDLDGCKEWGAPEDGGMTIMHLPGFCLDGNCEILVTWEGEYLGAFAPGMFWPVQFIQFSDNGWDPWVAGPAVNIAGVSVSDGTGINGDNTYDAIVGGGVTPDGSYFRVLDDSPIERNENKLTFDVNIEDTNNPQLENVNAFICKK
jgi:hypothetical protein